MTKYRRAYGLANALDDAALKKLWKLHFVKQINMTEQQLLLNFKKAHLIYSKRVGQDQHISDRHFRRSHHDEASYQVRSVVGIL